MASPILILENIRSAYNVGSIFRTADAAGVQRLYMTGYTPIPTDRFGRPVPEITKTALGATESVPWEHRSDGVACVQLLQATGVWVVAVEQSADAVDLYHYTPPPDTTVAYVLGNEVNGVSAEVRQHADQIIEIPMYGKKESLNVAVVAGVVLYVTKPIHA